MQYLSKLRFPEIDLLVRAGRSLVILPVGAIEEHGAHLPLGLDAFAAEAYAEAAAPHLEEKGYTVLLAPTVSYGVARQALGFPGTLTLQPDTLKSVIVDIGRSLAKHGLTRQVVLNGHRDGAHMKALDDAAKQLVEQNVADVLCVGFTSDPEVTAACCREKVRELSRSVRPEREGHAGEWETSLALFRFPELVDNDALSGLEPNFDYDVEALRGETTDYWTLTQGRGYFGSPGSASAETGEKLVSIRGNNIARVILQAWGPGQK